MPVSDEERIAIGPRLPEPSYIEIRGYQCVNIDLRAAAEDDAVLVDDVDAALRGDLPQNRARNEPTGP